MICAPTSAEESDGYMSLQATGYACAGIPR